MATESADHNWVEPNATIKWPHCSKCLVIRRADGGNGPCKGAAKLALREAR